MVKVIIEKDGEVVYNDEVKGLIFSALKECDGGSPSPGCNCETCSDKLKAANAIIGKLSDGEVDEMMFHLNSIVMGRFFKTSLN